MSKLDDIYNLPIFDVTINNIMKDKEAILKFVDNFLRNDANT